MFDRAIDHPNFFPHCDKLATDRSQAGC
jgi:hypothetical protein